jgi:hypothetical protein
VPDSSISRRDLLRGASVLAFIALQLPAANTGAPLFFNKDEFATLDTLTDLIIPTDEHSPGARSAQVAQYIDKQVAEAFDPDEKKNWRKGLACVNDLSQKKFGKAFLQLNKGQQVELLTEMSKNEFHAKTDAEKFFGQLKETTAATYYSSSIGIHEDMNYLGNVVLQEFVGYSV